MSVTASVQMSRADDDGGGEIMADSGPVKRAEPVGMSKFRELYGLAFTKQQLGGRVVIGFKVGGTTAQPGGQVK